MDPSEVRERVRRSTYGGWQRLDRWEPRVIARAEGCRFWDGEGREYLDFASQLVATNLGFGNPAVTAAIADAVRWLPYVNPSFATEERARLAGELDRVLPPGLRQYFFSTSGTEANEAAIKMARIATGRRKVIARTRSYHGATAASLSVSGDPRRRPIDGLGSVPGTLEAPDCYCYRCPLGLEYPACDVACAEEVERILASDPDVAAVIVEPVVGTNGVIVPTPEYLPKLRESTRRHGALLIVDEVMTGWGRTGEWFAVDHWKVRPDILTTAKAITAGYLPLGLTATTAEVRDRFRGGIFPHGHTFEAHPPALAAARAAIGEYRRLALIERSRREGAYLLDRLRAIADGHPSVGEVRGLGLFAAVELVQDRRARTPLGTSEQKLRGEPTVADGVAAAMMEEGVYLLPWISHLVLAPPLVIDRVDIDRALSVLDRALATADRSAGPGGGGGSPGLSRGFKS